jgi:hypothetical protein
LCIVEYWCEKGLRSFLFRPWRARWLALLARFRGNVLDFRQENFGSQRKLPGAPGSTLCSFASSLLTHASVSYHHHQDQHQHRLQPWK